MAQPNPILAAKGPIALAAALAGGFAAIPAMAADISIDTTSASQASSQSDCSPVALASRTWTPGPAAILADRGSMVSASKSAAILGGTGSALSAIRAQQAGLDNFGPLFAGSQTQAYRSLEPGAAPAPTPSSRDECKPVGPIKAAFSLPAALPLVGMPMGRSNNDDFLGSRRIAIRNTFFDSDWQRVRRDRMPMAQSLRRSVGKTANIDRKLEEVNRWVNHRITYTEDRVLFGKADYWAGPRRTLALGKGDCEDYALLKMHLLAAAGIPREDMYLTIARDLVRRADHAVLVVKTDTGYRMLDNSTDLVLDAGAANDYRPVLSFSEGNSWVHGYIR